MAWPKLFNEIKAQLDRIEAKLDAAQPKPFTPPPVDPEAEAQAYAEFIDYDSYTAAEIAERVDSLTPQQRELLRLYEQGRKNRKTVLAALS